MGLMTWRRVSQWRPVVSFSQQQCLSGRMRVVGVIRPGLPPWTFPSWLPLRIPLVDLLVTAASMTAVSLLEALSIARALADNLSNRPDPARELLGVGLQQYILGSRPAKWSASCNLMSSKCPDHQGSMHHHLSILFPIVDLCLLSIRRRWCLNSGIDGSLCRASTAMLMMLLTAC